MLGQTAILAFLWAVAPFFRSVGLNAILILEKMARLQAGMPASVQGEQIDRQARAAAGVEIQLEMGDHAAIPSSPSQ
jgi:hypothetical protein